MSVTQEAFDALAARVAKLENRTEAMFGHIFTALHELDIKVDTLVMDVNNRFDSVDRKLDEIARHLGGTA